MKNSKNLMFATLEFKHNQFLKNFTYFDGHHFYTFKREHEKFIVYCQDDTTKEFNYYTTIMHKELLKFMKYSKFLKKMNALKCYKKVSHGVILNLVNS